MKFYILVALLTSTVAARRPWRLSNSVMDNSPSFETGEYSPEQLEMWRKSLVPLMWGAKKVEHNGLPKLPLFIQGTIICNGTGEPYLRPYVHFEGAPRHIIAKTITDLEGKFKIQIEGRIDKKVVMVVRHLCPVEGLELPKDCQVPYFLTVEKIPEYAGFVQVHLDLNAAKDSTQPECY